MSFLHTTMYKGNRFETKQILNFKPNIQAFNTFQYLERTSAHTSSIYKRLFIEETTHHLRNTNDSVEPENILNGFKINSKIEAFDYQKSVYKLIFIVNT